MVLPPCPKIQSSKSGTSEKKRVNGNSFIETRDVGSGETGFILFTERETCVNACKMTGMAKCMSDAVDRDEAEVCLKYRKVMWSWSYTVIVGIKGVVKLPITIRFSKVITAFM